MAEAHLNGSLNLSNAEEVFRTVSEIAGSTVRRIPDGETGDRQGWIEALVPRMQATPELEPVARSGYKGLPVFKLREGASATSLEFPELGYAEAAASSHAVFADLEAEGVIAPGVRFQVSLPTITAGVESRIVPEGREQVEPAYARRLRAEVDQIIEAIPAEQLAIQWDVAVEMAILEGVAPTRFERPFEAIVDRLVEVAAWVPEEVPLGYHLCYGDARRDGEQEGRHFKEPDDMSKLVAVANAIARGAPRPLSWFSMPVPIDRDDDAYFEPLADIDFDVDRTTVYLGLVHHQDGVEGTQRRIDVALRHLERFGVSTECGMGRKPRARVLELLRIQRDVQVVGSRV